jgi:hypothetical protein
VPFVLTYAKPVQKSAENLTVRCASSVRKNVQPAQKVALKWWPNFMRVLKSLKQDFVSIASLFTSVSTLLCCALPSLLVAVGMGAVVAGMVSDFPALI